MVRALLAGTKTQTRRIVKDHTKLYALPGDRLWVRETWSHDAPDLETCRAAFEDASPGLGYGPYYRATEVAPDTLRWRPSIFMPRWASRLTLDVVGVRRERLQDISGGDAIAEGIDPKPYECGCETCRMTSILCPATESSLVMAYSDLWREINGAESWAANPWVWVISLDRLKAGR
jgi:hypothetical protein